MFHPQHILNVSFLTHNINLLCWRKWNNNNTFCCCSSVDCLTNCTIRCLDFNPIYTDSKPQPNSIRFQIHAFSACNTCLVLPSVHNPYHYFNAKKNWFITMFAFTSKTNVSFRVKKGWNIFFLWFTEYEYESKISIQIMREHTSPSLVYIARNVNEFNGYHWVLHFLHHLTHSKVKIIQTMS